MGAFPNNFVEYLFFCMLRWEEQFIYICCLRKGLYSLKRYVFETNKIHLHLLIFLSVVTPKNGYYLSCIFFPPISHLLVWMLYRRQAPHLNGGLVLPASMPGYGSYIYINAKYVTFMCSTSRREKEIQ